MVETHEPETRYGNRNVPGGTIAAHDVKRIYKETYGGDKPPKRMSVKEAVELRKKQAGK